MLERNRSLWQGMPAHCYADRGRRAGVDPEASAAEGWRGAVSHPRWTGPWERPAQGLPPRAGKATGEAHHAFLRHQPAGRSAAPLFALSRRRDGLFDRYGFLACTEGQTDAPLVGERHHWKGAQEPLLSEVLNGLDLHRPPCSALRANQVACLIGALAYDPRVAINLPDLNDDCQGWRGNTLIKKMRLLPGRLSRGSRQWVARVRVPGAWLCGWPRGAPRVWPPSGPGRPRGVAATG